MRGSIDKAAVIGSGVMGSGIAAHLANVGIPVYLFDLVPEELTQSEKEKGMTLADSAVRNRQAEENRQKLLKQKPAPLFEPNRLDLITACNVDDDLHRLQEADWVIEAVVENLEVKQQVLARIEPYCSSDAVVSTNTSGISVETMVEHCSSDFKKRFLGTHFFNPPRYLKLLEVIPARHTDPSVTRFMRDFAEKVLGKGVVMAKDTPNFIANRIGVYGLMSTVEEMIKGGYSVGEVDSVTGPALGRPKSATFRTLDIVGLDTFVHVADNVRANIGCRSEKDHFHIPDFVRKMVDKGWLGSKTGQGFFKKVNGEQGSEILELDFKVFDYVPRKKLKEASLQQSKRQKTVADRIRTLVYARDRAGELAWNVLKKVLLYSAEKLDDIADDVVSIDNALKWGFGWELGPFETWDAIGVRQSVQRMQEEGEKVPQWVLDMLKQGQDRFYVQQEGRTYYVADGALRKMEKRAEQISLSSLKEQGKVIKKNAGANLIDMGDGVALLEFQSPNNAIGADIIHMLHDSLEEVSRHYEGLVIGNQGKHFCVGANLMLILMEAQEMNWPEIDHLIRQFQQAAAAIRYSKKPVVAAPFGMTLGGGTEFCLPAARMQAAAETYMGLVETGVGLIPGGGGNKELLLRLQNSIPEKADIDEQQLANLAFETIAMAKVSTSAADARKYQFIRPEDGVSINQDHLLYEAKQKVLQLAREGYRAPQPQKIKIVGQTGKAIMKLGAYTFRAGGQISDHDYKIAVKLAHVLSGGDLPQGTLVNEQYLLDLEREAFLSLCGELKTQQRMQYMLSKGKPLRN